jgi:hypothetical protein
MNVNRRKQQWSGDSSEDHTLALSWVGGTRCRARSPGIGASANDVERLWAEHSAYAKTLDPARGVAGRDITSLLRLCPKFVLGKYLAVTRIDAGSLRLTDQEKGEGWWTDDAGRVFQGTSWGLPEYRDDWKVAYSPRISSIHGLPNETHDECCAGYDESYVLGQPVLAGEIEAFVNWGGFRLYDRDFQWCTDRFWNQMARRN